MNTSLQLILHKVYSTICINYNSFSFQFFTMWYTFRNQVMVTEFGIFHVRAKQGDEQQITYRPIQGGTHFLV